MNARPPLEEALGIPGARAVSLLDPEGPTVLWWGGVAPPDERQTAAVVTLAAAAAGLVMLAEPGDELGDVLLTSAEAFHVVRLMTDGPLRVAHLTLARTEANLAMARREFRSLIELYARQPRHASPEHSTPPRTDAGHGTPLPTAAYPGGTPVPTTHYSGAAWNGAAIPPAHHSGTALNGAPIPPTHHPSTALNGAPIPPAHHSSTALNGALIPPAHHPSAHEAVPAAGPAPLPRRAPVGPPLPAEESSPELPPALLDLLGRLYTVDDGVLDRILATLHHL